MMMMDNFPMESDGRSQGGRKGGASKGQGNDRGGDRKPRKGKRDAKGDQRKSDGSNSERADEQEGMTMPFTGGPAGGQPGRMGGPGWLMNNNSFQNTFL